MFLELLLDGLAQGSLLALICIGYSLAYGSAQVINFAHADVMIAGGGYLVLLWLSGNQGSMLSTVLMCVLFGAATSFATPLLFRFPSDKYRMKLIIQLTTGLGVALLVTAFRGRVSFLVAALLSIPFTAMLAAAIYRAGYLPLLRKGAPRTSVLLSALGFSIALESYLLVTWGTVRRVFPVDKLPEFLAVRQVQSGTNFWKSIVNYGSIPFTPEITIPVHDILIVLIFLLVSLALYLFFKYSRTADAIIASADSRIAARACGIPVEDVIGRAFLLGGAIAALGGVMYVLRAKSLYPMSGFFPGIVAFAACVMGGIGSLGGSVLGAFLVGFVNSFAPAIPLQQLVSKIVPHQWISWMPSLNLGDWSYGVLFALMIITILIKPNGLFTK